MFLKQTKQWIILLVCILYAVRVIFFPDKTLYDAYVGMTQLVATVSRPSSSPDKNLITDKAKLFTSDEKEYLAEYHTMLLDRFDLDYRIITLNEVVDINHFAVKTFNQKNIGSKSKTNRGLLLVIDAMHDTVRIETSTNLESVYTDSFISYIEKRQMIQFFKERKVAKGIFATSELIRIRAMEAKKGEEFDTTQFTGSFGGGAQTKANIGKGKDISFQTGKPNVLASDNPQETLNRYINALRKRNGRNDLDVFTPESRQFMGSMLSTPAQMDNSVKRLKNCVVEHITYNKDKTRAVLFHSLKHRQCDPFLFEKGDDKKWRLDLKALGLGTGHTFGNIWYVHYGRQEDSGFWKYGFGFKNVYFHRPRGENGRFDHQGIPYYNTFGMHINHIAGDMLVTAIRKDGFMDQMGIKNGDMIVEWEGVRYMHTNTLSKRLDAVRPGLDIRILIKRQGQMLNMIVKAPPYPSAGHYRFGFSYQSQNFTKTPIVHYVEENSQASKLGLQVGDLIYKWQALESPNKGEVYSSIKATENETPINVEVFRDESLVSLQSIKLPLRIMGKVH